MAAWLPGQPRCESNAAQRRIIAEMRLQSLVLGTMCSCTVCLCTGNVTPNRTEEVNYREQIRQHMTGPKQPGSLGLNCMPSEWRTQRQQNVFNRFSTHFSCLLSISKVRLITGLIELTLQVQLSGNVDKHQVMRNLRSCEITKARSKQFWVQLQRKLRGMFLSNLSFFFRKLETQP